MFVFIRVSIRGKLISSSSIQFFAGCAPKRTLRPYCSCGTSSVADCRKILCQMREQSLLEPVIANDQMTTLSRSFCDSYKRLSDPRKLEVLQFLFSEFRPDLAKLKLTAADFVRAAENSAPQLAVKVAEKLHRMSEPSYLSFIKLIGNTQSGIVTVVDMRRIALAAETEDMKIFSDALRELLALWFSSGLLELQTVSWNSPASLLEKISKYEEVHRVRNWDDIKKRVGLYRRCFAFMHVAMPGEPLVILHTFLTDTISASIEEILYRKFSAAQISENECALTAFDVEDANRISTAVFFSVTTTQPGLKGIDMGNVLIKQAVRALKSEFESLNDFSSLSPIPGFRTWINAAMKPDKEALLSGAELAALQVALRCQNYEDTVAQFKALLAECNWHKNDLLREAFRLPLLRLCARYIFLEKRRGYALNPVAHFHLRNGALVWRINYMADRSTKGLNESCSLMINYRYYLQNLAEYSSAYTKAKQIHVDKQVLQWL